MAITRALGVTAVALGLTACSDPGPTYHADAAPVIQQRCVACHADGEIAPFPLTTFEEVDAVKELVADSVRTGRMPPWQASDECNEYSNSTDLTPVEKETLLAWLDAGAPEGKAVQTDRTSARPAVQFEPDHTFALPEPYTPQGLDDYRCQIIDPGLDAAGYVTGFEAQPDRSDVVHHVIAFKIGGDQRDRFDEMDASEPGVGWPCYGGPTAPGFQISDVDLSEVPLDELLEMFTNGEAIEALGGFGWLGSWAPGGTGGFFPAGTGIPIEPDDFIVVQMHYNTASSGPVADQSSIGITVSDTVDKPAIVVPYADPAWVADLPFLGDPMTIPAGEASVSHDTTMDGDGPLFQYVRNQLALPDESPVAIRSVAHHMHTLGTIGRQSVLHEDDTETCLVEIPDWDFDWQSRYEFVEPVLITPTDELELSCTWDNSPENQPVVDGSIAEPLDVEWGEGTRDEMCLGILYMTAP